VPSALHTIRFDLDEQSQRSRRAAAGRAARLVRVGVGCSLTLALAVVLALAAAPSPASHAADPLAPAAPPAPVLSPGVVDPQIDVYGRAAATCQGLAPSVLAAIHNVETNGAEVSGPSTAGARGPMQFLPSTWSAYGVDADQDGRANIENLVDAVFGAARLLCANGGGDPSSLPAALWNYNHSWDYVRRVLELSGSSV
jgi:hypothetical protein